MKAVMISIQPKWCELIANGEKTVGEKIVKKEYEVRKKRPNTKKPFKCYIYCTSIKAMNLNDYAMLHHKTGGAIDNWHGKVIGEFICDKIEVLEYLTQIPDIALQKGHAEIVSYRNVEPFYGGKVATIHSTCLSNRELVEYGKGKPLYAWHISDLKIYDKPKELSEFNHLNKCPSARQDEYDGTWYCEEVDGKNAVVDKTKQFPYDEECIYFDCPRCSGENYENEEYAFCMCNGYKPFTRPPQSWQYCEELEVNKNE